MARVRQLTSTIAEWLGQALQAARSREPVCDVGRKLDAIRLAANYEFPTADIDQTNARIERGCLG